MKKFVCVCVCVCMCMLRNVFEGGVDFVGEGFCLGGGGVFSCLLWILGFPPQLRGLRADGSPAQSDRPQQLQIKPITENTDQVCARMRRPSFCAVLFCSSSAKTVELNRGQEHRPEGSSENTRCARSGSHVRPGKLQPCVRQRIRLRCVQLRNHEDCLLFGQISISVTSLLCEVLWRRFRQSRVLRIVEFRFEVGEVTRCFSRL